MNKTTLVIGASLNTSRYSNRAIRNLRAKNISVKAVGVQKGEVADVTIDTEKIAYKDIDTVSLYINPSIQKEYFEYIVSLQPRRVLFNPGTENEVFKKYLHERNIEVENACTLVLLATDQY